MNRIIMDMIFGQCKIAITEEDKLLHFFMERETEWTNYGDIYMGRIEQIKPGMQAAFVNIGSDKNALLHLSDIQPNEKNLPIHQLMKQGQELVVQIKKEAIGDKGARLTTKFSISGHYLVLLPSENKLYISKKIRNKDEKARLKSGINDCKPNGHGVIIRTEAMGMDMDILQKELDYLVGKWNSIYHVEIAPKILYKEASTIVKTVRDFYTKQIEEIVINDIEAYNELQEYFDIYFPQDIKKIKYINNSNLLEHYGIESKVNQLFHRKIWLKSGGYIIIDYTEACTVIDINSGKFTGNKNMDDTLFKINLEATDVIADQIRLRNISGIIIVDYINIKREQDQQAILNRLNQCLKKDKVQTKVFGFTELFILQMTRKQKGKSLHTLYSEPCKLCSGTGQIPNQESLFYNCIAIIEKNKHVLEGDTFTLKVNPYLSNAIREIELSNAQYTFVQMIKDYYKIKVNLEEDSFLDVTEMKIS